MIHPFTSKQYILNNYHYFTAYLPLVKQFTDCGLTCVLFCRMNIISLKHCSHIWKIVTPAGLTMERFQVSCKTMNGFLRSPGTIDVFLVVSINTALMDFIYSTLKDM